MKKLFALFLLIPSLAFAEETFQAAPAPKEYTVKLNAQDLQVIATSLSAAPYGQVAPVIAHLQEQISKQDASAMQTSKPVTVNQKDLTVKGDNVGANVTIKKEKTHD